MSLASYLGVKWFGARYDRPAAVLEDGYLCDAVMKFAGRRDLDLDYADREYLGLKPANWFDFTSDSVDLGFFLYHSNGDSFPDCDDAAHIARGQVLEAAVKHGFRYGPAFFVMGYKRHAGGKHALNLVFDDAVKPWLYEPQTGRWTSDLKDVLEVISVSG